MGPKKDINMGREKNCFVKKYDNLKIEFSSICVISLFFHFQPTVPYKKRGYNHNGIGRRYHKYDYRCVDTR